VCVCGACDVYCWLRSTRRMRNLRLACEKSVIKKPSA